MVAEPFAAVGGPSRVRNEWNSNHSDQRQMSLKAGTLVAIAVPYLGSTVITAFIFGW